MKNEFRSPLLKSAAILIGAIILATIAASAGSGSHNVILSFIAGVGHLVLFVIGLPIALGFSIAVLIAIFLAAVAMASPEAASEMYADLKQKATCKAC